MHRVLAATLLAVMSAAGVHPAVSQTRDPAPSATDSTAAAAPPAATAPPPSTPTKEPLRDRVYYGGSIVLTFGDVTRIGIYPMVAYKLKPKLSVGVELGYEYLKYDDYDQSSSNYGGSLFTRYRIVPQLYAHAEYQMVNYEIFTSATTSERDWVPFLLLGGGIASRVGPRTWTYVEVLFDVLNDDNSPYSEGDPFISAGVGVGF